MEGRAKSMFVEATVGRLIFSHIAKEDRGLRWNTFVYARWMLFFISNCIKIFNQCIFCFRLFGNHLISAKNFDICRTIIVMKFLPLIYTVIFLNLSSIVFGQSPGLTFGGNQNERGYSLAITRDSSYILAGSTRSFGAGSWDGYAIKLSREGKFQWSKTYGWKHHDYFQQVYPLDNGYLFLGHVWDFGLGGRDIYLLKTDLLGNKIFDKLYGTHYKDMGFYISALQTGGYLIVGYSRGEELHGDIFLLKIDEVGNEIWRNHYGSDFDDYAYSFVENEDGSIMLFGSLGSFHSDVHYTYRASSADWILLEIDPSGRETGRKIFSTRGHDFASAIKPSPDGGYYLFGSSMSFGAGSFDMLLMRVDEQGDEIWKKTFGGEKYEYGMSMDITVDGDIYLFGTSKSFGQNDTPDYYLVKTDEDGDELWSLTIGGNDTDYGFEVKATPDRGCAVIGQTKSFGKGSFDMMMVKVSKNGIIEQLIGGVDTLLFDQAVIYPNPMKSSGQLLPPDITEEYTMEIVSLNGTIVQVSRLETPNYRFSVETLPAGLYIYRISKTGQENYTIRGKLLIQ